MAPRGIALTDEDDRIVDDLVKRGRLRDADAVVREGLRLVAEKGEERGDDVEFADGAEAAAHVGRRVDDILSRMPRR